MVEADEARLWEGGRCGYVLEVSGWLRLAVTQEAAAWSGGLRSHATSCGAREALTGLGASSLGVYNLKLLFFLWGVTLQE